MRYDRPKNQFSGFTQAINQHFLETTPLVSTVAKTKSAVDSTSTYLLSVYEYIKYIVELMDMYACPCMLVMYKYLVYNKNLVYNTADASAFPLSAKEGTNEKITLVIAKVNLNYFLQKLLSLLLLSWS